MVSFYSSFEDHSALLGFWSLYAIIWNANVLLFFFLIFVPFWLFENIDLLYPNDSNSESKPQEYWQNQL